MKQFKKIGSVLLAVVMLAVGCQPLFVGAASVLQYDVQYRSLAQLLMKDHVRDLDSYSIENKQNDDPVTEGFNTEAGAFVYTHTVYAEDNSDSDILRAANRFYYIAESMMSTTVGEGIYSAELLLQSFKNNLKPYFEDEELVGTEPFYVNASGERVFPTEEEAAAYREASAAIRSSGAKVTLSALESYGVGFTETTAYDYYNVATVLTYFLGNGTYLNAGNWYHDFVFIVRTDLETMLLDMDGVNEFADNNLKMYTGIYRFRYSRVFSGNGTTASYAFRAPSNKTVYTDYGEEYGLAKAPMVIDFLYDDGIAPGQAENFFTKYEVDSDTVPYLQEVSSFFTELFSAPAPIGGRNADGLYVGNTWDSNLASFSNAQLENPDFEPAATIRLYASSLKNLYSNEVLVHLFGNDIGNITTAEAMVTSDNTMPKRTVRGTALYNPTDADLDAIIGYLDQLFTDEHVYTVLNMFLGDTINGLLADTPIAGTTFTTAKELVGGLLKGLLYTDSMVTLVVSKLYPLIAGALVDLIAGLTEIEALNSFLQEILESLVGTLNLALSPGALGDKLDDYPNAKAVLKAAGDGMKDWDKVNWEDPSLNWTKVNSSVPNGVPLNSRTAFVDALAATFRGLKEALLCVMLPDHDLSLLGETVVLNSVNGYEKLIMPLFRALGLTQAPVGGTLGTNVDAFTSYFYAKSDYMKHSKQANSDAVLTDILDPLLNWAEEIVAAHPLSAVCRLLPNLDYFLTRKDSALLAIAENMEVNLDIHIIGIPIDAYTESLYGLLEDTLEDFDSLNHILDSLVNLSFDVDDGTSEGTSVTYALPKFNEQKLIGCGDIMSDNTVHVQHVGKVLLYLLRYVFAALGYRYDSVNKVLNFDLNTDGSDPDTTASPTQYLPYLISCFGLDLNQELFLGLTLGDIIFNIMLHPDEALCAVLELFSPNEHGDFYNNIPFTYPMNAIRYRKDTLLNPLLNPTLGYGSPAKYSRFWTEEYATDVAKNLGPLADNILKILGLQGFETGLGGFVSGLLFGNDAGQSGFLTNDIVNQLFNLVYPLLSGVSDSLGFDLASILSEAFGIDITPQAVADRLQLMLGYRTAAYDTLYGPEGVSTTWDSLFKNGGSAVNTLNLDWGQHDAKAHGYSQGEWFIRVMSALLSPVSFVFEYLLLGQSIDVFNIVYLPAYPGYQYWFIALVENLCCPAESILTYNQYYEKTVGLDAEGSLSTYERQNQRECNVIYYFLKPFLGLIDRACADPVSLVLELLPNLMFFISVGALNDLLNNIVHFVYVLLDILKPIINGYDLVNGLIGNLEVAGVTLSLSIPLDLDFNGIISNLLSSLLGGVLVLGQTDVKDEEGNVIGQQDISLEIPYIDFYTLCAGKLRPFNSKEGRSVVHMNADSGGGFITAVLRLAISLVFNIDNIKALVSSLLGGSLTLDEYDKETIQLVIEKLKSLFDGDVDFDISGLLDGDIKDIVLFIIYILVTKLSDLSGTLADLLAKAGISVTQFIDAFEDPTKLVALVTQIISSVSGGGQDPGVPVDPDDPNLPIDPGQTGGNGILDAGKSLLDKIKSFFQRLIDFIKRSFGLA